MANSTLPTGFELFSPLDAFCLDYLVADGISITKGDVVYIDSNGYATSTDGVTLGVAMDNIRDGITGAVNATAASASYDYVNVCVDSQAIFKGQISTGLLTDPYTTISSDLCYDEAGSSGAQYIDAAASSTLTWKIVNLSSEYGKGDKSAYSAYQKVYCKFNPVVHAFGCAA
jgi:hypothetical protein